MSEQKDKQQPMSSAQLRMRRTAYRQQLTETFTHAQTHPSDLQALVTILGEAVFALVEFGGELCAQVAELREAIDRSHQ